MKKRITVLFLCFFIIALPLASCAEKQTEPQVRSYFNWFDTVSTVYSYAGDSEDTFLANCEAVTAVLEEYHRMFDIYYEYAGINNLCTVNKNAGKAPVKVDIRLIEFIEYAKDLYTLTNGEMNIALGAVLKLWHDKRTEANDGGIAALPDEAELTSAEKHTGIDSIIIDREACTLYLSDSDARIDVGALGKGYATERAAEALRARGISAYVLNIGGNVRCIGTRPSGDGWITGITNPDKTSEEPFVYRVELRDVSCVTSGNYERFYTVDGKRYHHIIDKDTLMPSAHFALVSVICADSGLADGLSTALFCMSYEQGYELVSRLGGVEVLWVRENGERLMTDGFNALLIN